MANTKNIVDVLEEAGITWRAYAEDCELPFFYILFLIMMEILNNALFQIPFIRVATLEVHLKPMASQSLTVSMIL